MLETLFAPDPSAGFSSISLSFSSSYDLYRFAGMKFPTALDRVRRQAAVLELFNRHDASDNIYYQQLFMQQTYEIELFDNDEYIHFFKKNLYAAMLSKESTAAHKLDGIQFLLKIKEQQSPLLLHDFSIITASFNRAVSFVRNKKNREELVDQVCMDTKKMLSAPSDQALITLDEVEKNLKILNTLTDRLDETQMQKMESTIQSILSNQDIQDQNEVDALLYSIEFLLNSHSRMHHESIKKIMPTMIDLLSYITNEISDAAYQFVAEVCVPTLNDNEFEKYWSDAVAMMQSNFHNQTKGLRLLTALFSKAKPELIIDILPLIRSTLMSDEEDVNIAAYRALIACIGMANSQEIEGIVCQAMDREPIDDDCEYTFFRIYKQFSTVILALAAEQIIKIYSYFMVDYDQETWPKNLGVLLPLRDCLERMEPHHDEHIRTILSYLIEIRKRSGSIEEILDIVTKDIFLCYIKLKDNNLIKQYISTINLELTLDFFEQFDNELVEFSIGQILTQLRTQRISTGALIKLFDVIANNMSSIKPNDTDEIISVIIKKLDFNGCVFPDKVPNPALNLILKYILQTTDYRMLKEMLPTLKNQDSVRYINTIMDSVMALNIKQQSEITQMPPIRFP